MSKVNVLVYSGMFSYDSLLNQDCGASADSIRHTFLSLCKLLSPKYAVQPVDAKSLIQSPWTSSTALLVFPGGRDLPYCHALNGEGNRKIRSYVQKGGSYLGLCGGAYYGCGECEFEVGTKLEVVGKRELAFFPGMGRGTAFPGFEYNTDAGCRAVKLDVTDTDKPASTTQSFKSYYNGGGVFVDASSFADQGVTVLARYTDKLKVQGGNAAAVHCKVGEGNVVLIAPHPEFAPENLDKYGKGEEYARLVDELFLDTAKRSEFLASVLERLNLQVQRGNEIPKLTTLYLTARDSEDLSLLINELKSLELPEKGKEEEFTVPGKNDTFVFTNGTPETSQDKEVADLDKQIKRVKICDHALPEKDITPFFDIALFYQSLDETRKLSQSRASTFGSYIMYGEVVTSTSTMLDK